MATQAKFLSFAILCAAGIAAAVFWHRPAPAAELTTGSFLRPSRELADFSLIDQQGKVFGSADPRLRAAKASVLPQVIFVSVDAKRDTPAPLAKYQPLSDGNDTVDPCGFIFVLNPDGRLAAILAARGFWDWRS